MCIGSARNCVIWRGYDDAEINGDVGGILARVRFNGGAEQLNFAVALPQLVGG